MTVMSNGSSAGRRRAAGAACRCWPILLALVALAGCGTGRPAQVRDYELASAQTFPFVSTANHPSVRNGYVAKSANVVNAPFFQ